MPAPARAATQPTRRSPPSSTSSAPPARTGRRCATRSPRPRCRSLAEAVALATRRIVGEWYDADPARTAASALTRSGPPPARRSSHCASTPRSPRVRPATLGSADGYVRPDDAVEIGGCLVDLASAAPSTPASIPGSRSLSLAFGTRPAAPNDRLVSRSCSKLPPGARSSAAAAPSPGRSAKWLDRHRRKPPSARARLHRRPVRPPSRRRMRADGWHERLPHDARPRLLRDWRARRRPPAYSPRRPVGASLLGRVLDGIGRPLDDGGEFTAAATSRCTPNRRRRWSASQSPRRMYTGVRAIDGFLTLGAGQRVGIFAGSGVGKSTLLGMLARGTQAGRHRHRPHRRARSRGARLHRTRPRPRRAQATVSSSRAPATTRPRCACAAANTATAIAEAFRAEGLDVLLLFDSLTRVAMAQREIGLAAGEPPTTKGYPPSVFSLLPHLMERTGPARHRLDHGHLHRARRRRRHGRADRRPRARHPRRPHRPQALARQRRPLPADRRPRQRLATHVARRRRGPPGRRAPHAPAAWPPTKTRKDLISIGAYVRGADADYRRRHGPDAVAPSLPAPGRERDHRRRTQTVERRSSASPASSEHPGGGVTMPLTPQRLKTTGEPP